MLERLPRRSFAWDKGTVKAIGGYNVPTHYCHFTLPLGHSQAEKPEENDTLWFFSYNRVQWFGMKSYREIITIHIPQRMDFVNITPQVAAAVKKSGVNEGLVLVNSMHITSSVFINDDESGLHQDYKKWLEQLAPFNASPQVYAHNRTGEDNGDAHHKRQIMGREVVVAITEGKLDFGTWEQIFYGEFDGRRAKRILIKIIGE